MKKLLLSGTSLLALAAISAPAVAADKAPPMRQKAPVAFSWTGCYAGVHVGYGWGTKQVQGVSDGSQTDWLSNENEVNGVLFGGQVGCNMQVASNFVVGLEGAWSGTNISGNIGDFNCSSECSGDDTAKIESLASVTGRVGWNGLDPEVMFYAKAGWAWSRNKYTWHPTTYAYHYQATTSRSGWTVGAGIEWAITPKWTAFIDYQHYDFGNKHVKPVGTSSGYGANIDSVIDTVKVGVNYRFNLLSR